MEKPAIEALAVHEVYANVLLDLEDIILDDYQPTKRSEEFTRGVYLSGYTVASRRFSSILDSAEAAGINSVVFDLKNMRGDIFFDYRTYEGEKDARVVSRLNIKNISNRLRKRNMRSVARIVIFHDQYTAQERLYLRPIREDGSPWIEKSGGTPSWLDSSHPEVQYDNLRIIERVASSGVDEIQMDYVRFPTQGDVQNALFYFQIEDQFRLEQDSTYVFREQRDIIEDFVKKAKVICTSHGVDLTADIFAITAWQNPADIRQTGQDIALMTKYLDSVHPMIYSSHFADNFSNREEMKNEPYYLMYQGTKLTQRYAVENCKVIPYIQAFSWRVNFTAPYLFAQIQAIKDRGAEGFMLWNANNNYDNAFRWLKKERDVSRETSLNN
jgi:hypothetical protein